MRKMSMIVLAALCLLWPMTGAAQGLPAFLDAVEEGLATGLPAFTAADGTYYAPSTTQARAAGPIRQAWRASPT